MDYIVYLKALPFCFAQLETENQHLKSCNQQLEEQVGALQVALEGKSARTVCGHVSGE